MFVQQSVSSYAGVIAKCQFDVHIAAERSPGLDLIVVGLAVRFVAVCIEPRGVGIHTQAVLSTAEFASFNEKEYRYD